MNEVEGSTREYASGRLQKEAYRSLTAGVPLSTEETAQRMLAAHPDIEADDIAAAIAAAQARIARGG